MGSKYIVFLLFFSSFSWPIIDEKVIICGVCKDVAERVGYSLQIMENIGNLFSDYRIIIYENNSSDTTPQILKSWKKSNHKMNVISEVVKESKLKKILINRLKNNDFYRPEAIARARNIVLKKALSNEYKDFDYLIWMDMDFKLEPSYDGFIEIFKSDRQWDAIFAYGIDPEDIFWDWYAFRDYRCPIGSELLGDDWWYLPKELTLTKVDDWYPVYSAFGGCAVYKKEAIKECRYSALVTKDLECLSHYLVQKHATNIIVKKYLANLKKIKTLIHIKKPSSRLSNIYNKNVGITTNGLFKDIVWRMSSFVYKYPSVCEHVTFHASMIMNGYNKLFINPRLVFYYGG